MDKKDMFDSLNGKIMDFVTDSGGCVREHHILRIFPEAKKWDADGSRNINYLIKRGRLFRTDDGLLADEEDVKPNKPAIAAIGVLCDLYDKVASYMIEAYPVQASFISQAGDAFEIIYVKYGDEAGLQASLSLHDQHMLKANTGFVTPKRIAIVDTPKQAETLDIPNIVRFAVMNEGGSMTYFNKKEES